MDVREFFETVATPRNGIIGVFRHRDIPIEEYVATRQHECPFYTLDKSAPEYIYDCKVHFVCVNEDGSFKLICSKGA